MKLPQDFIERVKDASNIVDVIGQYVTLRRAGNNFQGLCPFHNEKSPSFSVSETKQAYHCFGCGVGGSIFTFVTAYQGLTFPEAVEYLARRASIAMPELTHQDQKSNDQRPTLYRLNELAANLYHEQLLRLPLSHPTRQYAEARGLDEEMIKRYKLGWSSEQWEGLTRHLEQKRVPMALAEQLRLVTRRTNGKTGHFDWFRERLMFPIFSPTGQCLGFGGRTLTTDKKVAKYVNSTESPIFHKGRVFYGLDHAVKNIRTEDEAIVVEGYMDWLALARGGVNNVVATLGTALTADHARLIKRYTNRILLLFDGDDAGRSAARRSLPVLLAAGLHTRGLFLPNKQDPDDFMKESGPAELRKLITAAPDLFELITTEAWRVAQASPTAKLQFLDEFSPMLVAAEDVRLRRLYAEGLANLLDVAPRMVEQSLQRAANAARADGVRKPTTVPTTPAPQAEVTPGAEVAAPKIDLTKVPGAELHILNLVLSSEANLKTALEREIGEQFSHPGARATFERIKEAYRLSPSKFDSLSALLANEVQPMGMITRHLSEPYSGLSADAVTKLLQDCIKRVRETYLRSKSKALVSGLRGAGPINSAEQLEQIMNIHKSRRSLSRDS